MKIRYILAAVIVVFSILLVRFAVPGPPRKITIAGGGTGGAYYQYAQKYKELFAQSGIEVEVLATGGSIENIELLKSGRADIGFVQGGTLEQQDTSLRSLRRISSS